MNEVLTAVTTGIQDEDGLDNVIYAYQWVRDNTDIVGATSSTYTLQPADARNRIKVRVTFADDADFVEEPLTSAPTVHIALSNLLTQNTRRTTAAVARTLDSITSKAAQTFTTGAYADGYTIESVGFAVNRIGTTSTAGDQLTVTLNSVNNSGNPGPVLCTLADPATFRASGLHAFTPPASGDDLCPTLTASTTYAAVIDRNTITDYVAFSITESSDEHTAQADGWSIGDNLHRYTSSWGTTSGEILQIRITGHEAPPFVNSTATGLPTTTGDPRVGEILTADTSAINDENGLTMVSYAYQWITFDGSTDTDIAGATSSTYTIKPEDAGKQIKVKVTFTDDLETPEGPLYSALTGPVNTPASGAPTISGTPRVGETLTADAADISDADGTSSATFTYQWVRVDGETQTNVGTDASTYIIAPNDEDNRIKVQVTFTDDVSHAEGPLDSLPTDTVIAADLLVKNTGQTTAANPSELGGESPMRAQAFTTGAHDYGYTLNSIGVKFDLIASPSLAQTILSAAVHQVTSGDPGDSFCALTNPPSVVSNSVNTFTASSCRLAANTQYFVVIQRTGTNTTFIRVERTTSHDEDSGSAVGWSIADSRHYTSAAVWTSTTNGSHQIQVNGENVPATPNNRATGLPTITGTPRVNEVLTADTSGIQDDDGLTMVSYAYQWASFNENVATDISGATSSTYILQPEDAGKIIDVTVTFTDDFNHPEGPISSVFTDTVNTPATGLPAITGRPRVGEILNADTSEISDADGTNSATFIYQWVTYDGTDDTDISGATDSTYKLKPDDAGQRFKLRVTFTDDTGAPAGAEGPLASLPTEAVVAADVLVKNTGSQATTAADLLTGSTKYGQRFTTGPSLTGYILSSVAVPFTEIGDTSTVGTELTVTLNADSNGLPGDALCTFTDPDSFAASGLHTFTAPSTETDLCPELQPSTTYFVVLERADDNTDAIKWSVTSKLGQDAGSADGWSIDDHGHSYNDTEATWAQFPSPANLLIEVKGDLDTETTVPADWSLLPDGLNSGDKFRLLFLTAKTKPRSSDIETYNAYVQAQAAAGNADIRDYSYSFRILGSTSSVDARDNTETTYTNVNKGVPIYWLNGNQVADQYEDLYDGSWANEDKPSGRGADTFSGEVGQENRVWTGTNNSGTASSNPLRNGSVATGRLDNSNGDPLGSNIAYSSNSISLRYYALSGVFVVAEDPNNTATGLPTVDGTPRVNQTLTANTSAIQDDDGLSNVSYAYQWVRNDGSSDTEISRATNSTYHLTDDDINMHIKVSVTFTDDLSNPEGPLSSLPTDAVVPLVLIKNTGQTAAATPLAPDADFPKNAQAFTTGPNASGYTLGSIRLQFRTIADPSTAGSELTVTLNADTNTGDPGTPHCTLNDPSSFSATGLQAFSAPTTGTDLCPTLAASTTYFVVIERANANASAISYDITSSSDEDSEGATGWSIADVGYSLSNSISTWIQSDRLLIEINSPGTNTAATGVPSISGILQQGETITADTTSIADTDGLGDIYYQWIADGTDIDGATSATYTLTSAEVGDAISLRVTFTDRQGYAESMTSAATYAVVATGATSRLHWLSTMTVGSFPSDALNGYSGGTFSFGAISPLTFTYASVEYTIGLLAYDRSGTNHSLSIDLSPEYPQDFTLHVGNVATVFESKDSTDIAVPGYQSYRWNDTFPSWTDGQQIAIFLQESLDTTPKGVTLTPSTLTVDEGSTADYTVQLTVAPTADVTINITAGGDVSVNPTSLTFSTSTWNTDQTVTVTAAEDTDAADDMQSVTHTVASESAAEYLAVTLDSLAVTVTDDEAAAITLTPSTLTVDEGSTADYTVKLAVQPTANVTIVIGNDGDVTVNPVSLTFSTTNWSTAKTVTVTAARDADTTDDSLTVTHTAFTGSAPEYLAATFASLGVTIADNDVTATFDKATYSVDEGDTVTVKVQLSKDPRRDLVIPISTTDQDGATSADYSGIPASLAFASGDTEKSITFTADQDTVDDDSESVQLSFGTLPAGVTAGANSQGTVNITDDDNPTVTVSFEQSTYSVAEGSTVEIKVQLSADPEQTVVIPLTATNQAGATAADYRGVPATVTFQAGDTDQSFTFTANTDTDDDNGESVKLTFGTLPTDVAAGSTTEAIVSITGPAFIPEIQAPHDWSLNPDGLVPGNKFRLLFATSGTSDATSTDIADYNTFVQAQAAAGHTDIQDHSASFRVVASTAAVDARDNTGTTGTGVAIYWLDGNKVADDYADFYDNTWDDEANSTNQSGAAESLFATAELPFTGSNSDGTENLVSSTSHALGADTVTVGLPNSSTDQADPLSSIYNYAKTETRPFYAISGIFEIAEPPNNTATGLPTITGTARVNEVLTADTSGINDDDGITSVSYEYQWAGFDGTVTTNMTGATSETYTLQPEDAGSQIQVTITFTDDLSNPEGPLSSALTDAVNTPATGAPTITGAARVSQVLTANTSDITDADGTDSATFAFQWVRFDGTDDTDISGATSLTYTLTSDDVDKSIKVKVTFTDDAGAPAGDEGPLVSLPTDPVAGADVLVRNIGKPVFTEASATLSSGSPKFAQRFTTSSHLAGYTITSISVPFTTIGDTTTVGTELTVTLNAEGSSGSPGVALCTLTDPGTFSASGVHTFSTPTTGTNLCPELDPSFTYFVVLSRAKGNTDAIIASASNILGQDSGSADGWTIGNHAHIYNDVTATWAQVAVTANLLIDVKGTANTKLTVPADWSLKPTGLTTGDTFRLLFVTYDGPSPTSTDIATYNTYVQSQANAGNALPHIRIVHPWFNVLGSTAEVDARDNTGTTGTGEHIYWLNGTKVADNYADLYDGSWDDEANPTSRHGNTVTAELVWTGSDADGTQGFNTSNLSRAFGDTHINVGRLNGNGGPIESDLASPYTDNNPYYALSGIFEVGQPDPGITLSRFNLTVEEGSTADYKVKLTVLPTADVTIDITAGADVSVSPISLTFSTSTWNTDQTVTVTAAQDSDAADDMQTVSHDVATASADEYLGAPLDSLHVHVNDSAREVTVPSDWSLIPTGLDQGDKFRLLFLTVPGFDPTPTKIVDYNAYVQGHATGGHADIQEYSYWFRVLGSAEDYTAVGNTRTSYTSSDKGFPIYWLNGIKVVDDYEDLYDGAWDDEANPRDRDGATVSADQVWTGSTHSGRSGLHFGLNTVGVGRLHPTSAGPLSSTEAFTPNTNWPYYALSGVFVVEITPGVTITPSPLTVDEGSTADYNVKLTLAPTADVTIDITAGGDVSVNPTSLTFSTSTWNTDQTVTVTAAEDTDAADDMQSVTHTVASESAAEYLAVTLDSLAVTVTDDEAAAITLTPSTLTVDEGSTADYTVKLAVQPTADVTIAIGRDGDVTVNPVSLTFSTTNWSTAKTVTVTAARDADTTDDSLTVTHTAFTGSAPEYLAATFASLGVTIADNDVTATLDKATYSVDEGDTVTVKVQLNKDPKRDLTIPISKSDQNGATSADYSGVPASLTFASGDVEKSFTFTATQDDLDDDDESVELSFGALPTGVTAGTNSQGTVNITDDDHPAVTASFQQSTYSVAEGDSVDVNVQLNANPERSVTIPITTANQAGATAADYSGVPASVTFASGETVKTITFSAAQDTANDDAESVKLSFGTFPTGVSAGTTNETTVTITDNSDPVVTVKFDAATYTVAEGGTATVKVQLSVDPEREVIISLTTTDQGGATSGDYSGVPANVTFQSGDTEKSFTFTADQDTIDDDDESVKLGFGTFPASVSAGTPEEATVNITDDDDPTVTASFELATYSVSEGNNVTVKVQLNANPERSLSIPITAAHQNGATSDDYSGVPGSLSFVSGDTEKSFTFIAAQDTVDDDDESVKLTFGTLPTGISAGVTDETVISITDDDHPTVEASFERSTYTVAEGNTVEIKVQLTTDPEQQVVVPLNTTDQAGATAADYSGVPATVTFQAGDTEQSFTFRAITDTDDDNGESVKLTFGTLPTGVSAGTTNEATVSITGPVVIPENQAPRGWSLTPDGLVQGDKFRLMFLTYTGHSAANTDIDNYNTYVQSQAEATNAHDDIKAYKNSFRVVGSTAAVDARDNTGTTGTGVPIYWMNGNKVADDYPDFYDGSWDSEMASGRAGIPSSAQVPVWTGSQDDGTEALTSGNSRALGESQVRYGRLNGTGNPLNTTANSDPTLAGLSLHYYALSGIFIAPNAPAAGEPLIFGSHRVGEYLNTDTSSITDPEGTSNPRFTYQWVRIRETEAVDISGATGDIYQTTDEDAGFTIKVRVTLTDDQGYSEGPLESKPTLPVVPADVLVKNTAQDSDSASLVLDGTRTKRAQSFTTGFTDSHSLKSIGFLFDTINNTSTAGTQLIVTLHEDSSNPGDVLCTMEDPTTFTSSGLQTFVAPTTGAVCPILTPSTTYFAVIERVSNTSDAISLTVTTSLVTDPGVAPNWRVSPLRHYFQAGSWSSTVQRAHQIEIKGSVDTAPINTDQRTWVSNRQGDAATEYENTANFKIAQGFRTGDTAGIFEIHEISIDFDRGQPPPKAIQVRIVESSSQDDVDESATPTGYWKGGNFPKRAIGFDPTTYTFTLSLNQVDGTNDLQANTNYFLTIETSSDDPQNAAVVRMTTSEDETSNHGWTIDDHVYVKSRNDDSEWTKKDHQVRIHIGGQFHHGVGIFNEPKTYESCHGNLTHGRESLPDGFESCAFATQVPVGTPGSFPSLLTGVGTTAWLPTYETMEFEFAIWPLLTGAQTLELDYSTPSEPSVYAHGSPATANVDYQATSGTVTFNAGEKTKTVTVNIIDDRHEDSNEYVELYIKGDPRKGGGLTDDYTVTGDNAFGTIYNTEETVDLESLYVADVTVTEGEGATAIFTVSLSGPVTAPVSADYSTQDGTATAGTDYNAASGRLFIPHGETTATISVPILNDDVYTGDRTFTLNLSNPFNASTLHGSAHATIEDDEPAPLTAEFRTVPDSHDGVNTFEFFVHFSEGTKTPFLTMQNDVFTITNGTITRAERFAGLRHRWTLTIEPHDGADITIHLPITTDCDATGAVCTDATPHRPLSNSLTATITGSGTAFDPNDLPAVWSADMLIVEYSEISIGAATADLFTNIGGSRSLSIQSLWSYVPDQDLKLAFNEALHDADDMTLIVGDLQLEFPEGSSGNGSFKWTGVDLDWQDGDTIAVHIVPTSSLQETPTPNTAAAGQPTIIGTPQVGQVLTADTSLITDADGLLSVSYLYQWTADDVNIPDATRLSYTLRQNDLAKTVKVTISFNDDRTNPETLTSAATDPVTARPNTAAGGSPSIQGVLQDQQQLTADTAGITDADGLTNATLAYQWMRVDDGSPSDIAGQTGATYTLTASDVGQSIQLKVTFTDDRGFSESLTSAVTGPVTDSSSTRKLFWLATIVPNEDGQVADYTYDGSTDDVDLSPAAFTADEATVQTITYLGASQDNATEFAIDLSSQLTDQQTATWSLHILDVELDFRNAAYSATSTSPPAHRYQWDVTEYATDTASLPQNGDPLTVSIQEAINLSATGQPTISGTPQVGDSLNADASAITDGNGLSNASYQYQWTAGGSNIDGATASSLLLTSSQEGHTIQVTVTFDDDDGFSETATSEATTAVAAGTVVNSPPNGLPTISGTPEVDQTLTANTSAISDGDGLSNVSYAYQWLGDGSAISGATGSTLLLTSGQLAQTIQVRVTFDDDAGNTESLTSAATVAVTAKPVPLTASLTSVPTTHNGSAKFTFELTFSENVKAGYERIRDEAFTIVGGDIKNAKRREQGTNQYWTITVKPDGNASVYITLPATTDCDATSAICTYDGRRLSHSTPASIAGPQ